MQFSPDLRTGAEDQQANRFTAVAQSHHEQPRASVLATERFAGHGAFAVIDLGLFARRGFDHRASFHPYAWAKFEDEAPDALVAGSEAVGVHQILPNRHGVAATRKPEFDRVAVRRAGARGGTATGLRFGRSGYTGGRLRAKVGDHLIGRFCRDQVATDLRGRLFRHRVGDHLVGRFCRWLPPPTAGWSKRDPGGFQIRSRRFAMDTRDPLDPP